MTDQPDSNLLQLEFIIGTWKTEGKVIANDFSPEMSFHGTDTYSWELGKKFILHKVDVMMGSDKVEAFEMIYADARNPSTFIMTSFDNQGEISTMAAQVTTDGKLLMAGHGKRAVLTRVDGNKMSGFWEKSEDNENWQLWMTLDLIKQG